jgi:hypothetical protein
MKTGMTYTTGSCDAFFIALIFLKNHGSIASPETGCRFEAIAQVCRFGFPNYIQR